MTPLLKKMELKLLKIQPEAKNTFSFLFQRPPDFDFLPGQFLRLDLEIAEPDGRSNHRLFSIASSPSEKNYLMVTTKSNHSAFKKTLFALSSKKTVQTLAPYGSFILKPEETSPLVFLAGGIGVTPFRSMIRFASDMNLSIPITLFTSFRNVEDIIFQKELREIAGKHTLFKLVESITQPEKSTAAWRGNLGRIDEQLIKKNVPNFSASLFYLAGPPAMVDAMVSIVKSLGVDDLRIRQEKFSGY